MPVYNCEKYVSRSIQSVLSQSYENWELIVVNDGSKDSTEGIVEDLAKKDKRIKVVNQKNQGVSVARNNGMKEASGSLITFLDADDWFEENALELMISNWDDTLQMVLFDYYDVTYEGEKQYKKHLKTDVVEFGYDKKNAIDELELIISGFNSEMREMKTVIEAPWGRVFDAEYVKNYSFQVDVFLREDQVFNLKTIIDMNNIKYVSKPIYNYYINDNSVSGRLEGGKGLIENVERCNVYVKEIFSSKVNSMYRYAYYNYVYEGIKVILWWLADEDDYSKKRIGREYSYKKIQEIKGGMCDKYGLSDRVLIWLVANRCFIIVEVIVGLRKKIKKLLNKR